MARITMKSYEFQSREEFKLFLDECKEEMYTLIWESIEVAVYRGETSAYIAEVFLLDEEVYIDIVSERDEWIRTLTLALEWFEREEFYEKCGDIKRLMEEIEEHEAY